MMNRILAALVAAVSLVGLIASPASASAFNADERAVVTDWYQGAAVNADSAGVNYWANRFDGHNDLSCNSNGSPNYNSANRSAVAHDIRSFLAGARPEMNWSNHPSNNFWKVFYAYRVVLDRHPDNGGQTYWMNRLNSGTSWHTMVNSMVYSNEYKNNFIRGGQFEYVC